LATSLRAAVCRVLKISAALTRNIWVASRWAARATAAPSVALAGA
jgi:hypothetical protein